MIRKPGKRRPRTVRCKGCKRVIRPKAKGRIPTYCGQGCKQRGYINRRLSGPLVLLARDIASVQVRDIIRHEVWDILVKAHVVSGKPPPPERPSRKRPELRIVRGDEE